MGLDPINCVQWFLQRSGQALTRHSKLFLTALQGQLWLLHWYHKFSGSDSVTHKNTLYRQGLFTEKGRFKHVDWEKYLESCQKRKIGCCPIKPGNHKRRVTFLIPRQRSHLQTYLTMNAQRAGSWSYGKVNTRRYRKFPEMAKKKKKSHTHLKNIRVYSVLFYSFSCEAIRPERKEEDNFPFSAINCGLGNNLVGFVQEERQGTSSLSS